MSQLLQPHVMAHLYAVRDAPTIDAARTGRRPADQHLPARIPRRSRLLRRRPRRTLNIHRVPVRHRIRVRTTNLAERSVVEERRRTKLIGRLGDEHAATKLVYAVMIRAAERWCRVSISDMERHQLNLLRAELGLDPPPASTSLLLSR
jgi:putative transposase